MRPHHFAIGGSLCLAVVGFWMATAFRNQSSPAEYIESPTRHPVTEEMVGAAKAEELRDAPSVRYMTAEGETRDVLEELRDRPVVLLFIKHDCPCSIEAQPVFNNLADAYGERAAFFGIVNDGGAEAGYYNWSTQMRFPIIADPDLKVVDEYGADHSITLALLNEDGKIDKVWPGYSKGMLRELNMRIARVAGGDPVEFDDRMAPDKLTAGCAF